MTENVESAKTRRCPRCTEIKPVEEFYDTGSYCIPCAREYDRDRVRARRAGEPEVIARSSRWARWRGYGATEEQVLTLEYLYQFGTECDVCKCPLIGDEIHVDHDHGTLTLRGVLCASHNKGLGMFNDDVEILRSAITYLHKSTFSHKLILLKDAE